MRREEIIEYLQVQGLRPEMKADTTKLMISKKLIRCETGDTLLAAIGGDEKKDAQLHSVVDAVHWHLQTKGERGKLRLVLGRRDKRQEMDELLNGIALMLNSLKILLEVQPEVDFVPCSLVIKDFNESHRKWTSFFKNGKESGLPELTIKLSKLVGDESFRWYRNMTGNYWSGRVEGIQICIVRNERQGTLNVGRSREKGDGKAREIFLAVAKGRKGPFDESQSRLQEVADVIREYVNLRAQANEELHKIKRECLLESRILRNVVKLSANEGMLDPVCTEYPFQFPTLWAPQGKARFLDTLMHLGKIPWAVELKEPQGSSPGQDYRHAITQAVLYREFIRRAKELHGWFTHRSLVASQCCAAIAFPKMDSTQNQQELLHHHQEAARAFGVEVIEIEHGWDCAQEVGRLSESE